jgi:hypothetical protein
MKPRSKTHFSCQFVGLAIGVLPLPNLTITSKNPMTYETKIQRLDRIQNVFVLDELTIASLQQNL